MGLPFVDSDQVMEQRIGSSTRAFFDREGEGAFRDIETQVIDELTHGPQAVVATGGGAVLRAENRACLRERGQVVYLRSNAEDLYRRLRHDRQRPLLQVADPLAKLKDLHAQRHPLYAQTAHFVIDTGRPSVATLVNMILMQLDMAGLAPAVEDKGKQAGQA